MFIELEICAHFDLPHRIQKMRVAFPRCLAQIEDKMSAYDIRELLNDIKMYA